MHFFVRAQEKMSCVSIKTAMVLVSLIDTIFSGVIWLKFTHETHNNVVNLCAVLNCICSSLLILAARLVNMDVFLFIFIITFQNQERSKLMLPWVLMTFVFLMFSAFYVIFAILGIFELLQSFKGNPVLWSIIFFSIGKSFALDKIKLKFNYFLLFIFQLSNFIQLPL